ncbi:hypothetical protein Goari_021523 [Gossypium aridum]|uniref:Uncharacterized protein n=1 Tax=Gossypium aridum TaxID=34290 RepID=A0A7J8YEK3_GOSAI|nr:hypothetical protein [Gossypium aridum]
MAAEEEDVWAKATKVADDLYEIRDTFFPQNADDKTSKLQHESDLALNLLDSIPAEQRKLPARRAAYEYLRGKILDVVPDYRKEAEDHLSKAVKLNPSLGDAWLCLGNCIWKKGDLTSAKNCFNLALSKGPNKKILCQLSMLERRMAQGKGFYSFFFSSQSLLVILLCMFSGYLWSSEANLSVFELKISLLGISSADNQAEMVEESIQHAREAITLDVKDGNSWCKILQTCIML